MVKLYNYKTELHIESSPSDLKKVKGVIYIKTIKLYANCNKIVLTIWFDFKIFIKINCFKMISEVLIFKRIY